MWGEQKQKDIYSKDSIVNILDIKQNEKKVSIVSADTYACITVRLTEELTVITALMCI